MVDFVREVPFITENPATKAYQQGQQISDQELAQRQQQDQVQRQNTIQNATLPTQLRNMNAQADLATTQASTAAAVAPYAVPEAQGRLRQMNASTAASQAATATSKAQHILTVNQLLDQGDVAGAQRYSAQFNEQVPPAMIQNSTMRAAISTITKNAIARNPENPAAQDDYTQKKMAEVQQWTQANPGKQPPPEFLAAPPAGAGPAASSSVKPVSVPAGGTLVNPQTGQPVYNNSSGGLDPAAINVQAERVLNGDPRALQNIGRGAQGAADVRSILNRAAQRGVELGMDPGETAKSIAQASADYAGVQTSARVGATQETKMGTAAFEAKGAIGLARQAIQGVPRTGFLPFNSLIQGFQNQTLNPNQAELYTRTQGVINTYAAVMARGANVTTDSSRHRAEELLNTASNPEVYNRVLDTMESEITMAINSPEQMRQFYRQRYGAKALDAAPAGVPQGAGAGPGASQGQGAVTKPPPEVGAVEDGHRFVGGDPANPQSWQPVQ